MSAWPTGSDVDAAALPPIRVSPAPFLYAAPMKIARFSTGEDFRYGIVEGLPVDDPVPSGESDGHLIV